MHSGMTMGHEFMGIVESKGPNVKSVNVGDRVVSSFDIACGQCFFCKKARTARGLERMWQACGKLVSSFAKCRSVALTLPLWI